jgi:hypothetical protein
VKSPPFAYVMIRAEPQYRADAFRQGLRAAGFQVAGTPRLQPPNPDDVLVIWNRYGRFNFWAETFERAGARVVVAENGALGRDAPGGPWYSLCLTNPVAAGRWVTPEGAFGGERWRQIAFQLRAEICEWRKEGNEIIILAQRGIGPNGIRQPDGWHRRIAEQLRTAGHRVRIREHPGEKKPAVELFDDLRNARAVVTWASGAAFKALLWGVPVFYGCHEWVGRDAAQPLDLVRNRALTINWPERLRTFQRLAWCQWQTPEISAGLPFQHLLLRSFGSETTTAQG